MSASNQRHFLQKDLLEMDRLLELSGDDPITRAALTKRRQSLAKELEVVATQNAYLRVQSGDLTIALNADDVMQARERVGAANTSDRQVALPGTFRGATLDSWRFDFRTTDGRTISGRIADEVDDTEVERMLSLTNRPCCAELKETTITTRDGAQRTRYELLAVSGAQLPENV